MAKTKNPNVEHYFRIRNKANGVVTGSRTAPFYTKKGACQKQCDRYNKCRSQEAINSGIEYEVVTYEMVEVTRKLKIDKILKGDD